MMETSEGYRYIPFITLSLSEPKPRIWITLSGCNFRCKGCFSIARDLIGELRTVDELINFIKRSNWIYSNITPLEGAIITGGEPTLDKYFLLDLVRKLKTKVDVKHITLSTNGYLLDCEYITVLKGSGLNGVKLDLKAYTNIWHWDLFLNFPLASDRLASS